LNSDNKINSTDVSLMKRFILLITSTINEKAADLNGDGKVNSTDYSLLKQYMLLKITKFPVESKS
ncbi:MAG TPA: dockerin type I domain-containing protein, partial [Clostridia bacterium]